MPRPTSIGGGQYEVYNYLHQLPRSPPQHAPRICHPSIDELKLSICDVAIHEHAFDSNAVRDAFSAAVIAALLECDDHAFDHEGAQP